VLGYSAGAGLAAQIIIKDAQKYPFKLPHERPFRFAIFINGASPLHAFNLNEVELQDGDVAINSLLQEAESMFLRPSAVRKKAGISKEDQPDVNEMMTILASIKGRLLKDGTPVLTDGVHGLARYYAQDGEIMIDIPTLHIRSPVEEDRHHGLHLVELSDPATRKEYHHRYGHDFPRGRTEMKKIADLIRETADRA